MPIEGSLVFPDYGAVEHATIPPGGLWLLHELDEEARVNRVIAVHCLYDDSGAEVHAFDADDVDMEGYRAGKEVPKDLLTEESQIGYVFANTLYMLPTTLPAECGRLLLAHTLDPRYFN